MTTTETLDEQLAAARAQADRLAAQKAAIDSAGQQARREAELKV